MNPRPGTWGEVAVDSYIRDGEGTVWRVCAIDDQGYMRCKNRQAEWLTISPKPADAPVTLMVIDDEADVIALLRDKLGAEVIATRDNTDGAPWRCRPWPEKSGGSLEPWKNHLSLAHDFSYLGDVKTYKALIEAHNEAHTSANARGVPHIH